MIKTPLAYTAPDTLEEALDLLDQEQQVLAGDQSLVSRLKHDPLQPVSVVSLRKIPGLSSITSSADGLMLGALVTYAELLRHPIISGFPALGGALATVQDPHLRNHSTVGGAFYQTGSQHAPVLAALVALGAEAVLATRSGEQRVAVEDRLQSDATGMLSAGELLKGVAIPAPQDTTSLYLPLEQLPGQSAGRGIAVSVRLADGQRELRRLVLAGFTKNSLQIPIGTGQTDQQLAEALATVPAGYQRHLARVLVERALASLGDL